MVTEDVDAATDKPISVLLLEDIASTRELYAAWLREEGFEVFPVRALEGLERELERVRPDVALVDVQLHEDDTEGFGAAAIIKRVSPETVVAVFTAYGPEVLREHLPRVLGYTAELDEHETFDGVLLKDMSMAEIAHGIRELDAKSAYIAPEALTLTKPGNRRLTERERDCIKGLARGLSHQDLERELHLSPKTVYRAIESGKMKLGVTGGDGELVKAAYQRRVLEPG